MSAPVLSIDGSVRTQPGAREGYTFAITEPTLSPAHTHIPSNQSLMTRGAKPSRVHNMPLISNTVGSLGIGGGGIYICGQPSFSKPPRFCGQLLPCPCPSLGIGANVMLCLSFDTSSFDTLCVNPSQVGSYC